MGDVTPRAPFVAAFLWCWACADDGAVAAPDAGDAAADAGGGDAPGADGGVDAGVDAGTCEVGFVDDGAGGCEDPATPSFEEVAAWVDDYRTEHPGNGGMDWDLNALTPAEIAEDPAAQRLLAICGADQRPVIPLLAWEYGGNDHPWIAPEVSALVYCVYVPVDPGSEHWSFADNHVTADLYVLFPDDNPCGDLEGAAQVADCIGDDSNFEILVDTASLHDGHDVGLELSEASTELRLLPPGGGTPIHLIDDL